MRIDLNTGVPASAEGGQPARQGAAVKAGSGSRELAPDVAQLSSDHVRVQALTAAVSQLPEVRQEKVAALAQLVRSGTYSVTPQQTAEALISYMNLRPAA